MPQMTNYLYGLRQGRVIFDLRKSKAALARASKFIKLVHEAEGRIIILGNRPDVARLMSPMLPSSPMINFISSRWVPGILSNWDENMSYVQRSTHPAWEDVKKHDFLKIKKEKGSIETFLLERLARQSTKYLEQSALRKLFKSYIPYVNALKWEKIAELAEGTNWEGLLPVNLEKKEKPSIVVSMHARDSESVVKECHSVNVPLVGICDSDCDPRQIQYIIPGNDDSLKAQFLYTRALFGQIPSVTL